MRKVSFCRRYILEIRHIGEDINEHTGLSCAENKWKWKIL